MSADLNAARRQIVESAKEVGAGRKTAAQHQALLAEFRSRWGDAIEHMPASQATEFPYRVYPSGIPPVIKDKT